MMQNQAKSLSEKMSILEARDKQLRQNRERQTDIATATAVMGTCPDLCPEWERYFREETNQLSSWEMGPNNEPDPYAMVKEYRRAGADQEEPLPHELRPPPVLMRTMDYLLCNVMDRAEKEPALVGDWFDFLWSRTRAIRKDITQQHLCDLTSVSLMEKCARFHIHCAEALCEEDVSTFEPKINDENLAKCIQSLKDFYYDLSLKGNLCPNEAEFRGYDILLNLDDSDILREVKHLRREVRESPDVQFAVRAYFAFSGNNYVRFFQLVQQTSYLNASIMHRYFTRVRFQGLRLLRKAYTVGNQTESYPAEAFCRQLGFEGEEEVRAFCEALEITFRDNAVLLNREKSSDTNLNNAVPKVRARDLVESKRRGCSVGQLVNGGPLPANPYKQFPLHNSFDSKGKLKQEALSAEDQKTTSVFLVSEQQIIGQEGEEYEEEEEEEEPEYERQENNEQTEGLSMSMAPTLPVAEAEVDETITEEQFNRIVHELAVSVFEEGIALSVEEVATDLFNHEQVLALLNNLYTQALQEMVREVCQEVYYSEKERLRREEEHRQQTQLICHQLVEDVINQEVDSLIAGICREYYVDIESAVLSDSLLQEQVRKSVSSVAEEIYGYACDARDQLVAELREKHSWRIASQCYFTWHRIYRNNKRLRYFRRSFPAADIETANPTFLRIESVETKRKLSSDPVDSGNNRSTNPETWLKRSRLEGDLEEEDSLAPKLYAEKVKSNSNLLLEESNGLNDISVGGQLNKLKLQLYREKAANKTFTDTIEALKQSFTLYDIDE